jgi:colanic acid biosynthesis glycosyl transferase WcaI
MSEKHCSIILVNRFFGGAQTPTGRMAADIVEKLLSCGHQVTVITSRNSYTPLDHYSADQRIKMHFTLGRSAAGRLEAWLGFWLQTFIMLPFFRWNRCIIMTDPPFMIFAGFLAKLIHPSRKLYWWTMDLYPEALTASKLNFFGKSVVTKICTWLTNISLKKLTGIICLGAAQRQRLKLYKNWPKDDSLFCIIVPPWDFRRFNNSPKHLQDFKKNMGWTNKNIALYAGNLGEAHSFEYIVKLAKRLVAEGDSSWIFAFFCRGAQVSDLKQCARDLPNVYINDYLSEEKSELLFSAVDLHLITMADGWEGIVVPSKLYGVLHTTAPVLFVGPKTADTASEISAQGIGWSVQNDEDVNQTIKTLKHLKRRQPLVPTTKNLEYMVRFITG